MIFLGAVGEGGKKGKREEGRGKRKEATDPSLDGQSNDVACAIVSISAHEYFLDLLGGKEGEKKKGRIKRKKGEVYRARASTTFMLPLSCGPSRSCLSPPYVFPFSFCSSRKKKRRGKKEKGEKWPPQINFFILPLLLAALADVGQRPLIV